jgi:nucleotide-binding universal stress UspA family protein
VTVRVGEVTDQILTTAGDRDADLIVMVTDGRTGPARWLLGGIADEVICRSGRPVWVVPARAGDRIRGLGSGPGRRAAVTPP